jgi:hypothetical protein
VQKVCRFLFAKGPCTLKELRYGTRLSRQSSSKAVIALIQHSYVQPFLQEEVVGARSLTSRTIYQVEIPCCHN